MSNFIRPEQRPAWQTLQALAAADQAHLRELLQDPARNASLQFDAASLHADASRQRVTPQIMQALLQRVSQRVEREAQTLDQLALRLSHALPNPDRMREQIASWQQRLNQAWSVRMENWKHNQTHYQSQLEMLNPQRTLERGYAVILNKDDDGLHAVRSPRELNAGHAYQVQLAEGQAEVRLSDVKMDS